MTTPTTVNVRLKLRSDTASNWTSANPTLLAGELGRETDTGKIKIGTGSTAWTALAYQPFGAPITNADISATAEIAVSKLADGTARQLLQTDAAGTGVEWASNIDIPGTLDVTGAATFDAAVTVTGDLTVNGTTTTISTQNLLVEDKNIIIGDVASPTDVTADGGGITLKGATDKTINWVDATDAWTSSERFSVPLGTDALPSLTFTGDANTGIYSPGASQLAITTAGVERVEWGTTEVVFNDGGVNYDFRIEGDTNANIFFVDASTDRVGVGTNAPGDLLTVSTTGGSHRVRIERSGTTVSTGQDCGGISFYTNDADNPSLKTWDIYQLSRGSIGLTDFYVNEGATNRLLIQHTSGNVGIGTTTPGNALSVVGYGNATSGWSVGSEDGGTSGYLVSTGSTSNSIELAADPTNVGANSNLAFSVDGSERLRITSTGALNFTGAGTAGVTQAVSFNGSAPVNSLVVDSSGRLLVGTPTALNAPDPEGTQRLGSFQIAANTFAGSQSLTAFYGTSTVAAGSFNFARSQSTAVGTHQVVLDGRPLGFLNWSGSDGTNFIRAASIFAAVDGTPGTDDMPGRLVFSTTADGASSPTERFRITNDGVIAHDQPAPAAVNATATLTVANLKAGIITSTSAAATDMTLPTGTDTQAGFSGTYDNFTFEWSVINTGPSLVRVLAGTAHTVVGSGSVATGTSGRFASRRTAANTFVSYRLS